MASLGMTIESDDENIKTPDIDSDSDNSASNEVLDDSFDIFDNYSSSTSAVEALASGLGGTGSWNFKGAIALLAENDKGFPERVGVGNIIKAERREMLEGEDELGRGDCDDDNDSSDGSSSEDGEEDGNSSDEASSGSSSSDGEEDGIDSDHEKEDLDDDNIRNQIASDEDSDGDSDSSEDREAALEEAKAAKFFEDGGDNKTENTNSDDEVILFSQLNLSRPLMRGIAAIGYSQPTPIQAMTIPHALAGKDVCGSAVTGSGKTGAFLLPILEKLIHLPRGCTRALILAPTRELAAQCISMMTSLARFTSLTSCLIVGGAKNVNAQAAELRNRPDVVVATPGRLLDHVTNSQSVDFDEVSMLVLDEADRLLELGFVEEVTEIIKSIPVNRQTMLFSATFGTKVDELIKLSLKKPVRVRAGRENTDSHVEVAPRLEQEFIRIRSGNEANREAMLLSLLTRTFKSRVICFFDTKVAAHRMMIIAGLCGIKVGELHGNLTQVQRLEALEAFKNGEMEVLFCTDLAARGLDVNNVQAVINYEMPNVTTYVHRIGRTARAGCGGKSCTLISEGRRHLMKDVVRDAEKKKKDSKGSKGGAGAVEAIIKSRTIPTSVISFFNKKIVKLQPHIKEVIAAEAVAKLDRRTEMEMTKAENIILHADEIKSRPERTWFQNKNDKRDIKNQMLENNKGKLADDGSKKKKGTAEQEKLSDYEKQYLAHSRGKDQGLSRKKKRRLIIRREIEEAQEERRKEFEESGNIQKKVMNDQSMKASARAAKMKVTKKRDVDAYDDAVADEDHRERTEAQQAKKKIKRPMGGDGGGLFDDEIISFSQRQKKNEERLAEQKDKGGGASAGKYSFTEFDPNLVGRKKKGAKKGSGKFKSKSKHKRR